MQSRWCSRPQSAMSWERMSMHLQTLCLPGTQENVPHLRKSATPSSGVSVIQCIAFQRTGPQADSSPHQHLLQQLRFCHHVHHARKTSLWTQTIAWQELALWTLSEIIWAVLAPWVCVPHQAQGVIGQTQPKSLCLVFWSCRVPTSYHGKNTKKKLDLVRRSCPVCQ